MSEQCYNRVQTVETRSADYKTALNGAIKTITDELKDNERLVSLSHQVFVPRGEADYFALVVAVIHGCECSDTP